VFGATYLGPPSAAGARKAAHEFAADIIRRFGGEPLIGSKILFRSTRSGHKEIWAMDPNGENQRQLTDLKGLVVGLAVSPDSRSFSFTTGWPSTPGLALFSFDPVRRQRFDNPEATTVSTPAFLPDGSGVLYSACGRQGCRIYTAGADGRNPRAISSGARVDSEPKVNPKSGKQVLFVSDRGGPHQIYSMNLDGGDFERITNGEGYAANPSWHPNGQLMAFAWTRGYAPGGWNIFVMDVASRQFTQLTRGEGRNENPVWAPDGVHLVFTSTRSGSPQIWTMTADGNNLKQLTSRGANDTPVWSR
jgi:TolB protein